MKGRLKIVNESRYLTDEVERLVRFGLDEIDLKGERLVAVVKNTLVTRRRGGEAAPYSGLAYSLRNGIPLDIHDRYCGRRSKLDHLIILRLGPPEAFPTSNFRRYAGVDKREFADWREGLVAIAAHEGMHAQHAYDNAYRTKSGRRLVEIPTQPLPNGRARKTKRYRSVKTRVGTERIEPKAEAFEAYMLRRYRDEVASQSQQLPGTDRREEVIEWQLSSS